MNLSVLFCPGLAKESEYSLDRRLHHLEGRPMLSRICDAINERTIRVVTRINELPPVVRALLILALLSGVWMLGVWSGAFSKGHPQIYYRGR